MIEIYTDGSCQTETCIGGIGVFFVNENGNRLKYSKQYYDTTNNKMELNAVIKAFDFINNDNKKYKIFTDSQYVYNGITDWMYMWKENQWKKKNKNETIANPNLWKKLYELFEKHKNVEIEWIRAHKGNYGNEIADKLARKAMMKSTQKLNENQWEKTKQVLQYVIS